MFTILTPLSTPTCNLFHSTDSFSSCSRSTRTVKYHLHASGARHSPLSRLVEPVRHLIHCLRRQTLQHFRYQAVGGPIGLVHHHLPSCTENPVHCDLNSAPLLGCTPIAADPLTSDPFSLYLRGLRCVVVATFAMGSDLCRPLISVFTGTSVDPELRDHWSVYYFPSW